MKDALEQMTKSPKRKFSFWEIKVILLCVGWSILISALLVKFLVMVSPH